MESEASCPPRPLARTWVTLVLCLLVALVLSVYGCSDECPLSPTSGPVLIHPDGSGSHRTIQAAIDASAEGDTILLADGVFRGDGNRDLIFHGKNLVLCSQSGAPGRCTIDCEGSEAAPHRGISLHSGENLETVIKGITITNGYVVSDGGCIRIENSSAARLENLILSHSRAGDGGALKCGSGSNVIVSNCLFEWNMGEKGGAFDCEGSSHTVEDCTFRSNQGIWGGAVLVGWDDDLAGLLRQCIFEMNEAPLGGAVYIYESSSTIEGCLFQYNTANIGGALKVRASASTISGCTTFRNYATGYGGAVDIHSDAALIIDGCTLCYDTCPVAGASIYAMGGSAAQITHCIVAYSQGDMAIKCESAEGAPTLSCCNLYGNNGGDWTGWIAEQQDRDGNISLRPAFCGAEWGNFNLRPDSPCTDEASGCGGMGAWPVGCEQTEDEPQP